MRHFERLSGPNHRYHGARLRFETIRKFEPGAGPLKKRLRDKEAEPHSGVARFAVVYRRCGARRHEGLRLLQRIRDEAHRFAITYHRKRRATKRRRSALSEIAGIGPAKERLLLRHFGSLEKIRSAKIEEIAEVQGVTEKLARIILEKLE